MNINAQQDSRLEELIQNVLIKEGFENTAVHCAADSIYVAYENRIYRYEIRAAEIALRLVNSIVKKQSVIILIPQKYSIPIIAVIAGKGGAGKEYSEEQSGELSFKDIEVICDPEEYWSKLRCRNIKNPSTFKLDIVISPQINLRFGNYDDPVESQINLAPAFTTSLWKGMSVFVQGIVPLQNDFGEEGNHVRPGIIALNQIIRLPVNTYFSAALGYFTQRRYGFDAGIKTLLSNGRFAIGANAGYTGFASYSDNTWYYTKMNRWTYFLDCGYRFADYDLIVKAVYGKYLYEDTGWRFDLLRQFGEVNIGFFILKTTGGTNGGFNFTIPLFPSKYFYPSIFRISPSSYFKWEYKYRGLPVYGIRYSTGNEIDTFIDMFNPDYIKNRLLRQFKSY